MVQISAPRLEDSERAELEIVLAALARTPRLAKLLQYIADKYSQGKLEEISEYNIATEVFGRLKSSFDASRDSIARVEAHRLRKKLKEYYETEGNEHEIIISLPLGAYIPVFSRRSCFSPSSPESEYRTDLPLPEPLPSAQSGDANASQDQVEAYTGWTEQSISSRVSKRALLIYGGAVLAILLVAIAGLIRFHSRDGRDRQHIANTTRPAPLNQPSPQVPVARVPLRLLVGYDGTPKIDSAGAYWEADRYFHGGAAFRRGDLSITRTSDPMLFEHWRTTNFTYDIPLAPGPYELHLYFVASQWESVRQATFHIKVNDQMLLDSFDISSDALGVNVADEHIFRDIYPDKDGYLHLAFTSDSASASVNAIEILPGLPHQTQPIRLVMQQSAVTDHNGNVWHPDNYAQNGRLSDLPQQVSGTPDPSLYALERYGHFTYAIPVDTRDRYTLILHFAELYFTPSAAGFGGANSRVFRVLCNGTTLLDDFNIFKEAGSLRAVTKSFYHLRPSPQGKLNLTFEPIINNATVSAIEVIDEGPQ